MLKATVSGSFHRHMEAISTAVWELASLSVRVLSPADPRIVAAQGEFLFVASDRLRSVRLVQDRHLESIRAADFLWLVCPDGYVGQSAAMEIGAAITVGVPVFAARAPSDLTLREYVTVVSALTEAVRTIAGSHRPRRPEGLLITPDVSIEEAHNVLERIKAALTRENTTSDAGPDLHDDLAYLQEKLYLPICVQ